jgi:hypothetical protein
MSEKAIEFVMKYYRINREQAIALYLDEIEAVESLIKSKVIE